MAADAIPLIPEIRREKKMLTGELRNKIDRPWETFWTGGITNPWT